MTAIIEAENGMGNGIADEHVTVRITGQLFGLMISKVQDVFVPETVTEVPLTHLKLAGVLNLRGRIVTAIDMRRRLSLPDRDRDEQFMAVGIEYGGESYGLIIDSVGKVLRFSDSTIEMNPSNLDSRWDAISLGVQRLDGELLVILDVDSVLEGYMLFSLPDRKFWQNLVG